MNGHGFKFEPTGPDQWHIGEGKATERFGARPLMLNGHGWGKYLPKSERQSNPRLETMACTIYASLTALETLANRLGYKDFPQNCSERFSAILAGISTDGNPPHTSCEAIRKWGVIIEKILPFSQEIYDWAQYYSPVPMDENFIRLGQNILKKYVIGHEYVFNGSSGMKPKADRLIEALARGTVCVSVHAWKEKNGLYYKDKGDYDNHWVMLADYKEGDYWIIQDTYSPFQKRVAWDTDFQTAKLFFLKKNATGKTPNEIDYFDWLKRTFKFISSWLGFSK